MSSCQVRKQRAVGGNGDREVQGGGGDQRPDGLEEWKEGKVTEQDTEDADDGGEGEGKEDVRKTRTEVRESIEGKSRK